MRKTWIRRPSRRLMTSYSVVYQSMSPGSRWKVYLSHHLALRCSSLPIQTKTQIRIICLKTTLMANVQFTLPPNRMVIIRCFTRKSLLLTVPIKLTKTIWNLLRSSRTLTHPSHLVTLFITIAVSCTKILTKLLHSKIETICISIKVR